MENEPSLEEILGLSTDELDSLKQEILEHSATSPEIDSEDGQNNNNGTAPTVLPDKLEEPLVETDITILTEEWKETPNSNANPNRPSPRKRIEIELSEEMKRKKEAMTVRQIVTKGNLVLTVLIQDYKELNCVKSVALYFNEKMTIREVLYAVASKGSVGLDVKAIGEDNLEFFLPTAPNDKKKGILMSKNRTLGSYGLKDKDMLIMRKVRSSEADRMASIFRTRLDLSNRSIEVQGGELIGILKNKERGNIYLEELEIPARNVSRLFLNRNKLTTIPLSFILPFTHLKEINLGNNNFTRFPEQLCQLPHLTKVNLEDNNLSFIPSSITKLTNLKKLNLQTNRIRELPEEICLFTSLQALHLDYNNIKRLPFRLGTKSPLKLISVKGNPMVAPPMFVCAKGTSYILKYLGLLQHTMQTTKIQLFPFKKKVSFSTGVDGNFTEDSNQPEDFILSRRDSIFDNTKHDLYFYLECSKASHGTLGRSVVIQPFRTLPKFGMKKVSSAEGLSSMPMDRRSKRSTMLLIPTQMALFCLYGGYNGDRAAEYCERNLHTYIVNELVDDSTASEVLKNAFKKTDYEFLQVAQLERMNSGSSVLVAILIDNKLVVAQSGDCAAISIRGEMPHRITADHTFGNKDELQRAKALDSLFGVTPTSVIPPVSRGVGWLNFREPKEIITSDPEIFTEILTPRDQYIILGTKSIWSTLTEQKVVEIVLNNPQDPEQASQCIIDAAKKGHPPMPLLFVDRRFTEAPDGHYHVIVLKCAWYLDTKTDEDEQETRWKAPEKNGLVTTKIDSDIKLGATKWMHRSHGDAMPSTRTRKDSPPVTELKRSSSLEFPKASSTEDDSLNLPKSFIKLKNKAQKALHKGENKQVVKLKGDYTAHNTY